MIYRAVCFSVSFVSSCMFANLICSRNLLVVVCRNSAEVGVLQHSEDRLQWTMLDLENERAGTPFVGKKETFPVGECVLHSSKEPLNVPRHVVVSHLSNLTLHQMGDWEFNLIFPYCSYLIQFSGLFTYLRVSLPIPRIEADIFNIYVALRYLSIVTCYVYDRIMNSLSQSGP